MALPECTEEELQALYEWVDSVPLTRPKKSISRDFADGVMMAELVYHYFPKLVELHNYSPAHNSIQKMYNWNTLNQKVFKRMGFALAREQYEAVANAEPGAVERVLKLVRARMARFQESGGRVSRQQTSAQGGGTAAASAGGMACANSSQAGSPAHCATRSRSATPGAGAAAASAADSIAALRIAAEVPSKLLASGALCNGGPASPPFPTLDQALAASLADKEQQLEELRETNELLETKIGKLEQLVRLKDAKIQALLGKLQAVAAGQEQQQQQQQAPAAAPAAACQ